MRQVPTYLIIGNGRVARHFAYYFEISNIVYHHWYRSQTLDLLHDYLKKVTHILVLIRDDAIEPFYLKHLLNTDAIVMHCSGSLVSKYIIGAHPLFTFNTELYAHGEYSLIPFILDDDAPAWSVLFPQLKNPNYRLSKSMKAKYHALCVLSGNFSCLLWQKLLSTLSEEFNIPESAAHLYLQKTTENLINNSKTALTGPLIRKDTKTIIKNLDALEEDPFEEVYRSFITCYAKLNGD